MKLHRLSFRRIIRKFAEKTGLRGVRVAIEAPPAQASAVTMNEQFSCENNDTSRQELAEMADLQSTQTTQPTMDLPTTEASAATTNEQFSCENNGTNHQELTEMADLQSTQSTQPTETTMDVPATPVTINADAPAVTNTEFWCEVNVTSHRRFASAEESLHYLHWRNSQYFNHAELMPVSGQDGKVVLDYGCGPGNDLVGFCTSSRPKRLIGMDISVSSIAEARDRLTLHGCQPEMIAIIENDSHIPLGDAEVDHIHCLGVLHHTMDPDKVLREFRRVLKPSGTCRIMIYNYDSIWLHFFVAYTKMRCENAFPGLDVRAAFSKTCDSGCPIARVNKPSEFIAFANSCGFECRFLGTSISLFEITLAPRRFDAIQDIQVPQEHRDFLLALTFDRHGFPMWQGNYAGVNCYFELTPS